MRIFYAADHTPNSALRGSNLWYSNLFLPLSDLGHDVVCFDYDLAPHFCNLDPANEQQAAFIEAHRPVLEQALVAQITAAHQKHPIDLFFSYFYSAVCRAPAIEAIRDLGIVTMNWYCNASYQFHLIEELAPAYDYCLVPEKFRLDDYRRVGANPVYMQEAANPTIYKPRAVDRDIAVSFVGQRYGDRPDFVRHLSRKGIPVHVFGPKWQEANPKRAWQKLAKPLSSLGLGHLVVPEGVAGPPLTDDEMVTLYSRSKVCLGFSSCGETHAGEQRILQVRLRDFEAPMCAAFYIVEQMDELAEFFEPDREIVFYADKEDLADKTRFYLSRPDLRDQIRLAGHRRALAEHTWQKRFTKVFQHVGLQSAGSGVKR